MIDGAVGCEPMDGRLASCPDAGGEAAGAPPGESLEPRAEHSAGPRAPVCCLLLAAAPNPEQSFDSLAPCRANTLAVAVAHQFALEETAAPRLSPLYLHGRVGVGKTHLASAIVNAARPGRGLLLEGADLAVELERARRVGRVPEVRRELQLVPILVLDAIEAALRVPELQDDLIGLLNAARRDRRLVVVTASVPPADLSGVRPELTSRLAGGVVALLRVGDAAERAAILRRDHGGEHLPGPVLEYLAAQMSDDLRRLKAAAHQLLAMRDAMGVELTVDLAQAIAPLPEDLGLSAAAPAPVHAVEPERTARFKQMLAGAETEAEQALALQIAIGERLRQLREEAAGPETVARFERALDLLREERVQEAVAQLQL